MKTGSKPEQIVCVCVCVPFHILESLSISWSTSEELPPWGPLWRPTWHRILRRPSRTFNTENLIPGPAAIPGLGLSQSRKKERGMLGNKVQIYQSSGWSVPASWGSLERSTDEQQQRNASPPPGEALTDDWCSSNMQRQKDRLVHFQ